MIIYLVEPARHRRRGEEKVSVGGGAFRDSGFGTRAKYGKRTSNSSFCFCRIASVTLFALRVREV